jgi:hypothetical protein
VLVGFMVEVLLNNDAASSWEGYRVGMLLEVEIGVNVLAGVATRVVITSDGLFSDAAFTCEGYSVGTDV